MEQPLKSEPITAGVPSHQERQGIKTDQEPMWEPLTLNAGGEPGGERLPRGLPGTTELGGGTASCDLRPTRTSYQGSRSAPWLSLQVGGTRKPCEGDPPAREGSPPTTEHPWPTAKLTPDSAAASPGPLA